MGVYLDKNALLHS